MGLDALVRMQFTGVLITPLQGEGRRVFYCFYLLYEVEPVADEVAILDHGRISRQAETDVLRRDVKQIVLSRETLADVRHDLKILDERADGEQVAIIVEGAEQAIGRLGREGIERQIVDLNL